MIDMTWTTAPALGAGVVAARPAAAGSACAVRVTPMDGLLAPVDGSGVPSARLRALPAALPFGAGADERRNHTPSTLGIHSPGRPSS